MRRGGFEQCSAPRLLLGDAIQDVLQAEVDAESQQRSETETESDTFFTTLTAFFEAQWNERVQRIVEEESARTALDSEADSDIDTFLTSLRAFMEAQAAERLSVQQSFDASRGAGHQMNLKPTSTWQPFVR